MSTSQRIPELDALRGIAALLVVAFHYTTKFAELYGHPVLLTLSFPYGHYGVQLFFCISGFVIAMTLDRTRSWIDFVVSRFSRLYPSFWVAVVLTFTTVSLLGLPGKEVGAIHIPANLTMLPGLLGAKMIDGVYWTLQVELFFYALMLLLHTCGALRHIHTVCFSWLAMQAIYVACKVALGVDLSYTLSSLLILPHIAFFTVGIITHQIYKTKRAFKVSDIAVLGFANLITLGQGLNIWIVHSMCVLLFVGLCVGYLKVICFRPLLFFGTISYALYLLHENIGWAIMLKLYALQLSPLIVLGIAFSFTVALSALLVTLVEQPAMRSIRLIHKARKQSKIASSESN
jgi:peptidoglycan/LPS O-acetylase OafA/YrhL